MNNFNDEYPLCCTKYNQKGSWTDSVLSLIHNQNYRRGGGIFKTPVIASPFPDTPTQSIFAYNARIPGYVLSKCSLDDNDDQSVREPPDQMTFKFSESVEVKDSKIKFGKLKMEEQCGGNKVHTYSGLSWMKHEAFFPAQFQPGHW